MTARERTYRQLLSLRGELTARAARRSEIGDGMLTLTLPPVPRHALAVKLITGQLDAQLNPLSGAFGSTDTAAPHLGTLRVPDIVVVPEAAMDTTDPLDPHDVRLAVEIVSWSNPENDYVRKVADYAAMGIPHYLIVDPRDGTARHFWRIVTKDGRPAYDNQVSYAYGDTIPLDDGLRIDTSVLPRYGDGGE